MLSKPMWKCKCGKVYKAVFTVLGLHTKLNESHYPQKKKTLKNGELSQKQLAFKNYSKTALMTHPGGPKKAQQKRKSTTVEEFKNSVL